MGKQTNRANRAGHDPGTAIGNARAHYARQAWADAYEAFSLADRSTSLSGDDLECMTLSACLSGHQDEYLHALERTHNAYLESGATQRAVRCAFWLGMRLVLRGEMARGSGWLSRAQRLLEREGDCVEHGYLMLPAAERHRFSGEYEAGRAIAERAAEIGERFGDADLATLARHVVGRCLLLDERVAEGLALLDDAMLSVTSGALSPVVTGIVYCSVIEACRQVYALERAREWTAALARWCAEQPGLYAFTGTCLVHRAEIMELHGAWSDARAEAERAADRLSPATEPQAFAAAHYQIAEMHRLRGEIDDAERAYRRCAEAGRDPQPGLALLRLAQGRTEAARAAIARALEAAANRIQRARLLPACAEILLAAGDVDGAASVAEELQTIADSLGTEVLAAMAANARGAVALARDDTPTALRTLAFALEQWQRLEAPYLAARVRVLLGLACRQAGDEETARLELDTAGAVFEELGAAPDCARLASDSTPSGRPHGLTARELEVLCLVAAGKTNKAIAAALGLSVRTVDRHVGNVLAKLGVPSRAAATAFAYEHALVGEPGERRSD